MDFTPSTVVKLCRNVPLDNTYKDTLTFGSASAQAAYFTTKAKYTFTDFTYQRLQKSIRVPQNSENCYDCNYIMFQNANFGSKWFYGFVTSIQYLNQNTSEVFFELDVMQTWYFDYTVKASFVEREHASTDAIGDNLVPEGLETGEYIYRGFDGLPEINDLAICIATTADAEGTNIVGGNYSGVYSGSCIFAWDRTNDTAVSDFLLALDKKGKGGAISAIFLMPKALIPNFKEGELVVSNAPTSFEATYAKNVADIAGYVPKNKKLFTYPYNFLNVSTLNGNAAVYRYEYCPYNPMHFNVTGNIAPSPTVFLTPLNYKGVAVNYDESLKMKGYPLCSWTYGSFDNWLAQNALTLPMNVLTGAVTTVAGAYTGNLPLAMSGLSGVYSAVSEVYQHAIQPPQSRGTSSDGANVAIGIQTFAFLPMTITFDFAQRIDQFFSMFGYKTNKVKVPNITGRPSWNYVKTIDVVITGSVPVDDMRTIKNAYNTGITFWHGDWVGDYTRANEVN